MAWNVCLRVIEDMKALLLQNAPEINVVPMNGDWMSVQAARHGDDVLKWKAAHDRWSELRKKLMAWLCSTGNAFLWYTWDQNRGAALDGEQFGAPGQIIRAGKSLVDAISPMQVYASPHATELCASPYVMRRYNLSRQAAIRAFANGDPRIIDAILKCPGIGGDQVYWETALGSTPRPSAATA
ncbi:MAG: hypothetical protein IPK26_26350 [Planctomycetes bacterium]|nr:hypothetical protein [Planctomycetota bacterium]